MNIDTVMLGLIRSGKQVNWSNFSPPPPPSMLGFVSLLGGVVFVCCWLLLFRKVSSARYLRLLLLSAPSEATGAGLGSNEEPSCSPLDQFSPQTHFGQWVIITYLDALRRSFSRDLPSASGASIFGANDTASNSVLSTPADNRSTTWFGSARVRKRTIVSHERDGVECFYLGHNSIASLSRIRAMFTFLPSLSCRWNR